MAKEWPNGLLAWFTRSSETHPVYHTCWACHERKKIRDNLVDVTLQLWAIEEDERDICEDCKDYTSDVCCQSYPCDERLEVKLKEREERLEKRLERRRRRYWPSWNNIRHRLR